ncbi:hypothetical protein AVEN_256690-1 [Araneus ventricosus]|uniref:Uncharacterized protein n=1 Tax=Araneus ventricosus TaxID=182803 RepID=A0A4Y2EFG5_ARAVE|nr:hypothetical protein AVEN_256690-1 [Araneus ventricosus]
MRSRVKRVSASLFFFKKARRALKKYSAVIIPSTSRRMSGQVTRACPRPHCFLLTLRAVGLNIVNNPGPIRGVSFSEETQGVRGRDGCQGRIHCCAR